ncbi:PH and SEC7 domain-containing protein 4 [Hippoglossus hippoglossus]|uniref:PH and SEC7 domain-containing protein 4 n=1 Tax=Hippoglossus hippoglossus TaxID=8267 RepID=UPI00148E9003|nr:PH and SEC7 domain-containing protein 4 [Hippoglossus hippoglossus]XP_034458072.1 PH and SEC7 domain-containing protein 4 [Hippoglossus hippoglossus]XP_034458073.1 PH and SEC7 domain-containing protein 4 [Hippoglossus hippoglossus]
MEEEIICSSLLHSTDSVLQQPQQDSWTSAELQYISGEQEVTVLDETETEGEIFEAHGTDELTFSPTTGRETPDEPEQWDHIICPVRPSTSLSFATVQWDMPDPFTEKPSLVTDSSLANELDSSSVTSLGTTSPSLHQSEDDISCVLITEEREEQDRLNSQLLSVEWSGNSFEPCDAAEVQEPTTQEKEDSTHELVDSNNEIPLETDSEDEDRRSVTSDPVETVDIIETVWEAEGSEDEGNCLVDVKLEEEPEELSVLLTAQGDSEEPQNSVNGVEIDGEGEEAEEEEEEKRVTNEEEEEEEEEEKRVTNVLYADDSEEANTDSCPSDVEVTAEPLQTEDAGLTPDKLIHLHPSELVDEIRHSGTEEDVEIQEQLHEDSTGRTEETEMCKGVDHNVEPEQPEAVDNSEEALMQETENAKKTENLQAIPELPEEVEEESRLEQQYCDEKTSPHPERSECEQLETIKEPEPTQEEVLHQIEEEHSDQLGCQHLKESPEMEVTNQSARPETAERTEECTQSDRTVCVEAKDPEVPEQQQQQQTEPPEQNEQSPQTADVSQPTIPEQHVLSEDSDESEITEQLSAETEVTEQTAEAAELNQVGSPVLHQAEELTGPEDGGVRTVMANGEKRKLPETPTPHMNGGEVDREMARRLAEQLFKLDGIQPVDVVKHLDKDNDFSHAVGEEYLKFFDFTGQTLDHALRSFLKVVVLIGESQERERVLQHFACRFHQCNPEAFSSSGAVLALTCALMLLNTDLHGQHVGKSMSSSQFVSNLDGMNEGENFSKDLLKSLHNSIKSEPLEWAVDEDELQNSVLLEEDVGDDAQLRSKANPFQVVAHDKNALVVKEGFLLRKLHADIDGKRTPWGKRGWKTFYGVLRGMVLYLQKDDYKRDHQVNEEVVSVHHSVAEQATDYTKKPHVFRLQTADWRVFLFQASSKVEMKSWISRFNLVSALHSSPPFPAAVGSQRKFFRPILPASQSAHTLERQLQFHAGKLESFKADLFYLQQNPPEGRKARAKELEEHRIRAEYLHYEMCRYEIYIQVLEAWKKVDKTGNNVLSPAELNLFDKALCADSVGEEDEEDGGLKKSHSSPSLEQEMAPPTVIKVRRNISERRTYRRTIIPRWNKEA